MFKVIVCHLQFSIQQDPKALRTVIIIQQMVETLRFQLRQFPKGYYKQLLNFPSDHSPAITLCFVYCIQSLTSLNNYINNIDGSSIVFHTICSLLLKTNDASEKRIGNITACILFRRVFQRQFCLSPKSHASMHIANSAHMHISNLYLSQQNDFIAIQ